MPSPDDDLHQHNPDRYERLSQPHESKEVLGENLKGFFRELGELREKWGIPDVLMAVAGNYKEAQVEGPAKVMQGFSCMQYGDSRLRPALVLYLYRQESDVIQALMRGLTDG